MEDPLHTRRANDGFHELNSFGSIDYIPTHLAMVKLIISESSWNCNGFLVNGRFQTGELKARHSSLQPLSSYSELEIINNLRSSYYQSSCCFPNYCHFK
jgi:hypothetical protein